jgi:hypothetical protein
MTQKDLTTNDAKEPTVSIDVYGVTLATKDAKIALATETILIPEDKTLGIKGQKAQKKGLKISFGTKSFIEFTDEGIKIRAPKINIGAADEFLAGIAELDAEVTDTGMGAKKKGGKVVVAGTKITLDGPVTVNQDVTLQKNCKITGKATALNQNVG